MVQKFNMTIDDQPIAEQKKLFDEPNVFADVGGVAKMGDAMDRGMVLSLAIWADPDSNMNWLDSCMQNISKFDCSLHPTFDSTDVFWEAWREQPGAWRGPVDVYPHLNTSFESQTITLSYPYVPMWMKTQTPFQCAKTVGSFDCSAVKYGFSVKDCDVGGRVEADSGRENRVTRTLPKSCPPVVLKSYPQRIRRAAKLPKSCLQRPIVSPAGSANVRGVLPGLVHVLTAVDQHVANLDQR